MAAIMILAGEASGDLHAGALTKEILRLDPSSTVYGMGGDAMRAAGGEILYDIKEHGVMGVTEVIAKLPALFRLKASLTELMETRRPDCLVVIDYPEFNMRLAKVAHAKKIPVVSFISPSAWVWRKGRAKDVAKIVTTVAAIFTFERDVYVEAGANVEYVGHPLLDIVKPSLGKIAAMKKYGKREQDKLILLLPGSRKQEIEKNLPVLLQAAKIMSTHSQEYVFWLPKASTIDYEALEKYIQQENVAVRIIEGNNYDIMSIADLALATSGTVTLEAAICELPMIIIYKTSWLTAFLARILVNFTYIGLPNMVAGQGIVPELLQEAATPENIAQTAEKMLLPEKLVQVKKDLALMIDKLGGSGAVTKVATLTLRLATQKKNL